MLLKGRFVEDRTLAEERVGKQACELPEKGADRGDELHCRLLSKSVCPARSFIRGNEMLQAHRGIRLTLGGFAVNWPAIGNEIPLT